MVFRNSILCCCVAFLFGVAGFSQAAWGQVVTGSIVGSVADRGGGLIANATVKMISETTGAERATSTDQLGNFVFTAVRPDVYTLVVEHSGFKRHQQKQITLVANERLSVGEIRLELGGVADTITVTAQGATVQTASAERGGVITASEVGGLTVISRDFNALTSLLPGVVTQTRAETEGAGVNPILYVQGLRGNSNNTQIDGLPIQDLGQSQGIYHYISIDSLAEVKIQVSGHQAEFGRTPGASIQAVTKSGTREFHGALYWYKRHEEFNANNFFNNRNGVPQPLYRFTSAGGNLGGPLYIPGKFNRDRNKLFFFFSAEELRERRPQPIRQVTMPTERERRGDFSDSRDLNGALITVRDPLAGQPFPGNVIPTSRINTLTQKYLGLFPLPNFFDVSISARRYNYQVQESWDVPKHNEVLRVDYNIGSATSVYGRFNRWWDAKIGWTQGGPNWGLWKTRGPYDNPSGVVSATRILDPSLVLEVSMGVMRGIESADAERPEDLDRINRTKSGMTIPQFFPINNPFNLVPQTSFGGLTGAASVTYDSAFPKRGADTLFTWSASLSKTRGAHVLKAGMWAERARNYEGKDGNFAGAFNFGRDVNNPNDANHPYANALLGNFASYTESTTRPWVQARSTLVEWYAQDNWKASRRLTLDYGVRFGWAQPYHGSRREEAAWVPGRFDPAKQVRLIEPVGVGSNRVGRHPITGQTYPGVAIGAIAPGWGDPYNGTVNLLEDRSYPQGLRETPGIKVMPRFGFAYDPFGKGGTAVRGGFGSYYRLREQSIKDSGICSNPPMREDPVIYYGNVDSFMNSAGLIFPSGTTGLNRNWPVERVMSFNLGVQQNIGFGTVFDVSYVGSLGRHLAQGRNLNSIPFGANFQKGNEDPSNPGRPLPAAFLRPYVGYNDITLYEYAGNSSYHSLQATVNRRFARTIQYGASWTWSKAMDYVDALGESVSNLVDRRVWNYGKAGFDRTHVLTVHWMWDIPKASRLWNNAVSRSVLDGWQVSGIATFSSGAPLGIGYSLVQATDTTGSPTDGARVVVAAKPTIPKSQRTFSRNFNTEAFRPPVVGTIGNAAKDLIRGPGINNWDISVFKNFSLGSERRKLQFRSEFYNVFNHTQFSSLDTTARFDQRGNQVNARFGEYTAALAPRRIQFALRFTF